MSLLASYKGGFSPKKRIYLPHFTGPKPSLPLSLRLSDVIVKTACFPASLSHSSGRKTDGAVKVSGRLNMLIKSISKLILAVSLKQHDGKLPRAKITE